MYPSTSSADRDVIAGALGSCANDRSKRTHLGIVGFVKLVSTAASVRRQGFPRVKPRPFLSDLAQRTISGEARGDAAGSRASPLSSRQDGRAGPQSKRDPGNPQ